MPLGDVFMAVGVFAVVYWIANRMIDEWEQGPQQRKDRRWARRNRIG